MKKQKKIRKRIDEIQTRDKYSGEKSPYWDFMREHQRHDEDGTIVEDVFANPDMLSEDDRMYHPRLNAESEFKLRVIQRALKDLSPQQRQVLQLCGIEGMDLESAAKQLKLKVGTVQYYLEEAQSKILKRYKREKLLEDTLDDNYNVRIPTKDCPLKNDESSPI